MILNEKIKNGYEPECLTDIAATLEKHKEQKSGVIETMNFMLSEDCGFTEGHISACAAILDVFCDMLKFSSGNKSNIMHEVKNVVCALNALNESADCALIETDEREQLYEFIDGAAKIAGLVTDEDITEEWRDW